MNTVMLSDFECPDRLYITLQIEGRQVRALLAIDIDHRPHRLLFAMALLAGPFAQYHFYLRRHGEAVADLVLSARPGT